MSASSVAILGLGANLGDRMGTIRRALRELVRYPGQLPMERISPIYESDAMLPEGVPPEERAFWEQPFLNLAVRVRTTLPPQALLARVKEVERRLGRQSRPRWAPREIDIDVLAYEGVSLADGDLKLPHPGLKERPFALLPFAEVAPEWILSGRSVADLARAWRHPRQGEVLYGTHLSSEMLCEWVGILNVTPDSFSDGGKWLSSEAALRHAEGLIAAGATVLDVGAESTRPGATPLPADEEWARLEPVLAGLAQVRVSVSVDTRHAETARKVLRLYPSFWINDVCGAEDPAMREAMAEGGSPVVIMHSLGVPASAERVLAASEDPVATILSWAEKRVAELVSAGVARERIILDPGVGFGKSARHSLELLERIREFHALGLPLYVGHSRKSFLQGLSRHPAPERDPETAAVSLELIRSGVDFLRVHEVEWNRRVVRAGLRLNGVIQRTC